MTNQVIHVAHSIGRKNGTHYVARAYCVGPFGPHSFAISIDENVEDAEKNAVEYVRRIHLNDGMVPPRDIVNHGRLPRPLLDLLRFHKTLPA